MPHTDQSLSDRLRVAIKQRLAEGMTLSEFANQSDTQIASLSRFLAGKGGLHTSTLDRLHRIVRIRVDL